MCERKRKRTKIICVLNMKERNKESKCVTQKILSVCVWVRMHARATLPSPQILLCLKPPLQLQHRYHSNRSQAMTLGITLANRTRLNTPSSAQLGCSVRERSDDDADKRRRPQSAVRERRPDCLKSYLNATLIVCVC